MRACVRVCVCVHTYLSVCSDTSFLFFSISFNFRQPLYHLISTYISFDIYLYIYLSIELLFRLSADEHKRDIIIITVVIPIWYGFLNRKNLQIFLRFWPSSTPRPELQHWVLPAVIWSLSILHNLSRKPFLQHLPTNLLLLWLTVTIGNAILLIFSRCREGEKTVMRPSLCLKQLCSFKIAQIRCRTLFYTLHNFPEVSFMLKNGYNHYFLFTSFSFIFFLLYFYQNS